MTRRYVWLVAYTPASLFKRSDAERNDQALSWARPDKRFFAAGACHILAWAFITKYPESGFFPVGLSFERSPYVNHVYVSDGDAAFDFYGWSTEQEILTASAGVGEVERVVIAHLSLEKYCQVHYSRLPSKYHGDVWNRALEYLTGFTPPGSLD